MKPHPWIRLLAYQSRATHEQATREPVVPSAWRVAATGRNLALLRAALALAIELRVQNDNGTGRFDCTCTNGGTEYGFTVRVTRGPSAGHILWVDQTAGHIACGFHSEALGCGCLAQTASIGFEPSAIVLRESGAASGQSFVSAEQLAAHLLEVLTAHAPVAPALTRTDR